MTSTEKVGTRPATRWGDRLGVIGDECGFTFQEQISNAEALGLAGIEFRSIAGRSLGEYSWRDIDAMAGSLQNSDLDVVALDSPIGTGRLGDTTLEDDVAKTELWLEMACRLGAPSVRVMSYVRGEADDVAWHDEVVRRLLALRELAARYDRVLLHENCAGWGGRDAESARRLMDEVGGEHLGFLMDTGNGVWYGYDTVEMAEAILPFIRHVHIKDARLQEGDHVATAVPCLPGMGVGRVRDTLAVVLDAYPDMTMSFEPHLLVQPHLGIQCDDGEALKAAVGACMDNLAMVAGPGAGF